MSLRIRYVVRRPLVGCNIGMWVTYRGTILFLTFDTDEDPELLERRKPGQYEAMIPLPAEMLKAGSYTISLDSGIINQASRPEHQHFENRPDVRSSRGVRHLAEGVRPQRPGALALRLNWDMREVGPERNGPLEHATPRGDTA